MKLTKEEEIKIAEEMEKYSIGILTRMDNLGLLDIPFGKLIQDVRDGNYDISYNALSRRRLEKSKILEMLDRLRKNPTREAIERAKLNYLLAFRLSDGIMDELIVTWRDEYVKKRNTLIESNLDIAKASTRMMIPLAWQTSYEQHDVIGEGIMALIMASGLYDPKADCKFCTYAAWVVYRQVFSFIRSECTQIRIPDYNHKRRTKLLGISDRMEQVLGRKVTLGELEDATGLEGQQLMATLDPFLRGPSISDMEDALEDKGTSESIDMIKDAILTEVGKLDMAPNETDAIGNLFHLEQLVDPKRKRRAKKVVASAVGKISSTR